MIKKLSIFILIVLLGGGVFYLFYLNQGDGDIKGVSNSGYQVQEVVNDTVISPSASFDKKSLWYFTNEGRLFNWDLASSKKDEYPIAKIDKLAKVIWPKQGNDFIAFTFNTDSNVKKYYNSQQNFFTDLPNAVGTVDWMPDSRRIVYFWQRPDKSQLSIANSDLSGFRVIKDFPAGNYQAKVSPDGTAVLVWTNQKIYLTDIGSGQTVTLLDMAGISGAAWVPNGESILLSRNQQESLMLLSFESGQVYDLNLNTSIDKILFDERGNLLAAVNNENSTTFVRFDLNTINHEILFDSGKLYEPSSMFLVDGDLYFVNNFDKKVYVLAKKNR